MTDAILFYSFSIVAIVAAFMVITRANPLMSALWLIVCLAATAAIFALLGATLIAVLQVLVYAGAVMVLFLFVIMFINVGPEAIKPRVIRFGKVVGVMAIGYLAVILLLALGRPPFANMPPIGGGYVGARELGILLLTRYAVPFEMASLLLLAAIVGAVVMGKRKL